MKIEQNNFQFLISIIIPTFNNEEDLPICLTSIKKQNYPKNKIEILLCDGGSKDTTVSIAKKFRCKILANKKQLAEYGVALGMAHARGEVIIILAADNELYDEDFIKNIVVPFEKNSNVMLAYPMQVSTGKESWIADYINTFTDPINHFIYGDASNTRTFYREYVTKEKTSSYIIYQFNVHDYPMLALAQGTAIRKVFQRKQNSFGDDLAPVVEMIKMKHDLAYVPKAKVIHHTTKTLHEFIRKQRWAVDNYLLGKNYGIRIREQVFSRKRKIKKLLWPIYACSIIFPILFSIKGLIVDKEKAWIYHAFLTFVMFMILVFEVIRVRIFRVRVVTQRKTI